MSASPSATDVSSVPAAQPARLQYARLNVTEPAYRGGDVLTVGFGTTVAMWTVGYFCRLFGDAVPAPAIFIAVLACLLLGGAYIGRYGSNGLRGATLAGLVAGLLNLLIVGSLVGGDTPNAIREGALLWVPGTIVACVALMALGAVLGRLKRPQSVGAPDWPGQFAIVASFATFVLVGAGGLVTGWDEGLAVVDWPNTEGYNMFLYPLARMTGGVYLEHAHRLLGSLVGLTVLVLAIHISLTEPRGRITALAWVMFILVAIQGVLGGLRVTGVFTLSTDAADTDPNILLAIIHGVLGQLLFAGLVGLAVFRSRAWATAPEPTPAAGASTDRFFGISLLIVLVAQLVMGALVRHFSWALEHLRYGLEVDVASLQAHGTWALHLHITVAVVVTLVAIGVGVRAWGLYREKVTLLSRLGIALLLLIGLQLALGIAAMIVTGDDSLTRLPTPTDVAVTTAHQVVGAALLACTVMLVLWNYRRLQAPAPQTS